VKIIIVDSFFINNGGYFCGGIVTSDKLDFNPIIKVTSTLFQNNYGTLAGAFVSKVFQPILSNISFIDNWGYVIFYLGDSIMFFDPPANYPPEYKEEHHSSYLFSPT
jgi:hypothetical protein